MAVTAQTTPAKARPLLNELKLLSEAHPNEPSLRQQFAKSVENYIKRTVHTSPEEARALLDEIMRVSEAHLHEPALHGIWSAAAFDYSAQRVSADKFPQDAEAVVELIPNNAKSNPWTDINALHRRFYDLLERHPEDGRLRETIAKGFVNIITLYGQHQLWQRMKAASEDFQAFLAKYRVDETLQVEAACWQTGRTNSLPTTAALDPEPTS
jgi:hypothetical protein